MERPLACGLSVRDVHLARSRLEGAVRRTPLVLSAVLSEMVGERVYLKLENRQHTGSFKLRGALNAILAMSPEERGRGVVTVSTGNHGRAVAFACRQEGIRAVVCVSRLVPGNKLSAITELGAEIRIVGRGQDEAQLEAERLVAAEGLTLVPPFDHAEVIAGQGTLGLEIKEQLAELGDASSHVRVLVPLSGGGLLGGVALALKSLTEASPQAAPLPVGPLAAGSFPLASQVLESPVSRLPALFKITAVSMEQGCAMYQSLQAGRPVEVEEKGSLADSLGGGIGLENRYTFELVRELVDEHVLVSEEAVASGIRHAYQVEGEVVEGAGAVGIAALLAEGGAAPKTASYDSAQSAREGTAGPGAKEPVGATVVVVSGSNIDSTQHARLVGSRAGGREHRREFE